MAQKAPKLVILSESFFPAAFYPLKVDTEKLDSWEQGAVRILFPRATKGWLICISRV